MNSILRQAVSLRVAARPFSRTIASSALRRFPDANAPIPSETYASKARPSSVHASPESDVGRGYMPPSSSSAVKREMEKQRVEVTNAERLSSSVLRQITYQLRNSEEVKAALGDGVRYSENWWGFGEPWISGNVNLPQGKVDLKFRIKGDKEHATVYFTSIRPEQNSEFRIVRYKVVTDSGKTLQMPY
ncbi:hypothetical protein QFC19_008853 [Naganishia cerealis]|uniref:Uncharacterized protein n=1 Tax=Naganishia cerealis TaxID=610337 RepID=A0ACC2UYB8_9TREE|nr:hypothetical protein QFC19_008853 [Naganishia cerealis]